MNNKPIAVGDLVMVVRGHDCIVRKLGGVPMHVERISQSACGGLRCSLCGSSKVYPQTTCANFEGKKCFLPLAWLIRIEPPAVSQQTESTKELMNVR